MHNSNPAVGPAEIEQLLSQISRALDFRAGRLAALGTPGADADDLRQDLVMELLAALPRFDPDRGPLIAFAWGVLSLAYCETARRAHRQREGRLEPVPLNESDLGTWLARTDQALVRLEARLDAAAIRGVLKPEEHSFVDLLFTHTVAEAAASMGAHRGTGYRWIGVIRSRLSEETQD